MARKTSTSGQGFLGWVPPPPGSDDPFEETTSRRAPTFVPSDGLDDETPFEDEIAEAHALGSEPERPPELPPPGPDPRELARRLAEEARAKARAIEPRRSREKLPPEPEPEPEPAAPSRKSRLAERAGRPLSAEEAFKRAAVREADEAQSKKKNDRVAARAAATAVLAEDDDEPAEPKRKRRTGESLPPSATPRMPPPRESRPVSVPDHEPAAPIDVAAAISRVAPGSTVVSVIPLSNPVVFRALWMAHRARAWATRDLGLLATSAVLLDAIDRIPAGHLVAVHAIVGGREVAAWIDTSRGALLGLAEPPEVYLAGL